MWIRSWEKFLPEPMMSFQSERKLSIYFVCAKLYALQRKVGSSKCGKSWCEVCYNVNDTSTFISTVTGDTFKINHSLNCDVKCRFYLVTCKACNKQYTGETTCNNRNFMALILQIVRSRLILYFVCLSTIIFGPLLSV